MFATPAVDDRVEETDSTLAPESRVNRTHMMNGSIALVSAIVAFVIVRAWFAPAAATAVAPATLIVESQPAGATLLIDDQPRGTTPSTFSIAPGPHTLVVRSGPVTRTVQLTLGAAQAAQYFDLTASAPAANSGRLSVVTEPPGARVSVDGRARGVSPLALEGIPAGAHTIVVTSDTGSAQRNITVVDGVAAEVVFTMPRSSAPQIGWLTIASPFPVDVIEHDQVVGTSGTTRIMLAAGRHDVLLRNESVGYETPRTIDVAAGNVTAIEVTASMVPLNINARPWADVLIDGNPVGQTPLANIEVAPGPHAITFRHPELGERTQTVVVTANGPNRVSVDFTK